jgi:CBS domain-containing protein
VDYCWINMGSAARYEQTLRTDQDNAIIFADPAQADADATAHYFRHLAEQVVDGLARCGFERCTGGVMASNPKWCRSISRWLEGARQWMTSPDTEDIRTLTILLDFRSLWGNTSLADSLWKGISRAFSDSVSAGHMLSRDDQKLTAPIGFLGKIVTERSGPHKGRLNLKTTALVHMINAVRLLAVHQGISPRLPRWIGWTGWPKAVFEPGGCRFLQGRLRDAHDVPDPGKPETGRGPADRRTTPWIRKLDKSETLLLKDALSAVSQLQKRIGKTFQVPWMNFFGH